MAIKKVSPHHSSYGEIQRGTSLTIPVKIMTPEEEPVDLTGYHVAFTIKPHSSDFDYGDKRAYVAKDFEPHLPADGMFFVELTSEDLNFEPGKFYFDIELYNDSGAVSRLVTLDFDLIGGPTNRTVNAGLGQLSSGEAITVISLTEGRPVVVITPITGDATVTAQVNSLYQRMVDLQEAYEKNTSKLEDQEVEVENLSRRLAALEKKVELIEGKEE